MLQILKVFQIICIYLFIIVLIFPDDSGRSGVPRCRCIYFFGGIWPRETLNEKILTSLLKCSSLYLPYSLWARRMFFPEPFLIPSSPGVCITWNQTSDGWVKTSTTNWKWPMLHPWTEIQIHIVRRGQARCTHVSHPSQDGETFPRRSFPIVSHVNLPGGDHKMSCGSFISCMLWFLHTEGGQHLFPGS